MDPEEAFKCGPRAGAGATNRSVSLSVIVWAGYCAHLKKLHLSCKIIFTWPLQKRVPRVGWPSAGWQGSSRGRRFPEQPAVHVTARQPPMPKLIRNIRTNAGGLSVGHVIQKMPLWKGKGRCCIRRSIIHALSGGEEVSKADHKRLFTCAYDTENETLVHMTKEPVVWPSGSETGGCYNDNISVVGDRVQLKMGLAPKCLKQGDYDAMMHDQGRPIVMFVRDKKDKPYACAGKLKYVASSFIAADPTCVKLDKKLEALVPQPTARFEFVDVSPAAFLANPGILVLPVR